MSDPPHPRELMSFDERRRLEDLQKKLKKLDEERFKCLEEIEKISRKAAEKRMIEEGEAGTMPR